MDEFYVATNEETPVTIVYPTGGIDTYRGGRFYSCIHTRVHYYGTPLSFEEISEKLLEEGFIDKSGEADYSITSIDPLTCEPYDSGQHEFRICETEDWGFEYNMSEKGRIRKTVQIELYFNEDELYGDGPDCWGPDECELESCAPDHKTGFNYEYMLKKLLELNDGD